MDCTKTLLSVLEKYGIIWDRMGKKFGMKEELKRTRESKKVRPGHGKMRNSRYVMRKGPLIIYGDENNAVKRIARNLPGVETCSVHRLNLL